MKELKQIILFFLLFFGLIIFFIVYGNTNGNDLTEYEPIQIVRPTTNDDEVLVYDSILEFMVTETVNKPYVLVTQSEESDIPNFKIVDYGTYREIDSLKCIRYEQMQWKMCYLDKLNEKSCN